MFGPLFRVTANAVASVRPALGRNRRAGSTANAPRLPQRGLFAAARAATSTPEGPLSNRVTGHSHTVAHGPAGRSTGSSEHVGRRA
jgi:hypothetical protein